MRSFNRYAGIVLACLAAAVCGAFLFPGCGTTKVSLDGASIALYHGGIACYGTIAAPGAPTITAPLDSTTCANFPPFSLGAHYAGNRVVTDSLTIAGVDARVLYAEYVRLRIVVDSLKAIAGRGK